jgi:hypothetical protein
MTHRIVETFLSADVAGGGNFTIAYPSGTDEGRFFDAEGHVLIAGSGDRFTAPTHFTLTLGTATIQVNWRSGSPTLRAGTFLRLQLEVKGWAPQVPAVTERQRSLGVASMIAVNVPLGAPDTASATGIAGAQLFGGSGSFVLNGAIVSGGVARLDVPRNVTLTVATTDHSARTITVTGTDVYGNVVRENIAGPNANTVQGKKAFTTVTAATVDGAVATNGISIGFGDVLGLPVFLPGTAHVVREIQDGAPATAGTVVAGDSALATATTGDVRGTYDPNAACDGDKVFELFVMLADPAFIGVNQFAG